MTKKDATFYGNFYILIPAYSGCHGNWPLKRALLLANID